MERTALEAAWRVQAVRLHQRYVLEVVEACGLCPWAEPARVRGRVRDAVVLEADPAACVAPSIAALDAWQGNLGVEVAFLLYPRLALDVRAFDVFTTELRDRAAAGHPLGGAPFVFAGFHPSAVPDVRDGERLIPFLRRTPDPCVQVLRTSIVERARSGTPQGTGFFDLAALAAVEAGATQGQRPLREQIASANLETAMRMGIDALAARLDDIRRDRDQTYAALEARELDESAA